MAQHITLNENNVTELIKKGFLLPSQENKFFFAPLKHYNFDLNSDLDEYRFSLLLNGTLDGRSFYRERDFEDYMLEIKESGKEILLFDVKKKKTVHLSELENPVSSLVEAYLENHPTIALLKTLNIDDSDYDRFAEFRNDIMSKLNLDYDNEDTLYKVEECIKVAIENIWVGPKTADGIQKIALNANSNMDLTDAAAAVKPKHSSPKIQ